jgi:hypothetical protein
MTSATAGSPSAMAYTNASLEHWNGAQEHYYFTSVRPPPSLDLVLVNEGP